MKRLRMNLQAGHVLVWMDFAENFLCSSVEEIQSAYCNSTMVTLHTIVVYFPDDHSKKLQSFVALSDLMHHNSTAVYAVLRKLLPILKKEYPQIATVHYLTDSPTSQYRNKFIFQILQYHFLEFGLEVRWNYLESGHGKGPCDVLGGSVKRSADMAVKQGKCSIQGAQDFYAWGLSNEENGSKVKYFLYSQDEYATAAKTMEKRLTPMIIHGTLKLHAVVPVSNTSLCVRELSCNCQSCIRDPTSTPCEGWTVHQLKTKQTKASIQDSKEKDKQSNTSVVEETITHTADEQSNASVVEEAITHTVDQWVAAVYDGRWYIGVITETDENDSTCLIEFMTRCGKYENLFNWPPITNQIWVANDKILLQLEQPSSALGKTKRCFKLEMQEIERIDRLFSL
ncbi:uncharacterized protein LOC121382530 [Gigantopelta aegis]|uniref:uncharacterized protein LOC121382530 n=1 Tax=Gigantopelta aegis TaxID=1735272 RepID=UPI001B887C57|nr:uncharacterized protein LOC121382530 [Gigantopelta aegis]